MSGCAVPTCPQPVPGPLASFCDDHWALVPSDYRKRLYAYRSTDPHKNDRGHYADSVDATVAALIGGA